MREHYDFSKGKRPVWYYIKENFVSEHWECDHWLMSYSAAVNLAKTIAANGPKRVYILAVSSFAYCRGVPQRPYGQRKVKIWIKG